MNGHTIIGIYMQTHTSIKRVKRGCLAPNVLTLVETNTPMKAETIDRSRKKHENRGTHD